MALLNICDICKREKKIGTGSIIKIEPVTAIREPIHNGQCSIVDPDNGNWRYTQLDVCSNCVSKIKRAIGSMMVQSIMKEGNKVERKHN